MRMRWIYGMIIVGQFLSSGTFIAAKWALMDFPPLTLAFIRFLIAAAGLYGIHRAWPGRRAIERRDWAKFALLGALAVVINQACFLYGLRFTSPTHAALLYGTTPVFVFLLAVPFLGERPTFLKLCGVLVTFAGAAVIVTGKGLQWGGKIWFGDLLIILAVVAWALYTVIGKPLVAKYGAVHTTAISLIIGTIFFIPIGLFNLAGFDAAVVTTRGWWSLLYIAIGTSIVAYTIWFWALDRMEATKLAVYNNMQPVITAILSYFLMGERLGVRLIVGGVMVILGVVLTERG